MAVAAGASGVLAPGRGTGAADACGTAGRPADWAIGSAGVDASAIGGAGTTWSVWSVDGVAELSGADGGTPWVLPGIGPVDEVEEFCSIMPMLTKVMLGNMTGSCQLC